MRSVAIIGAGESGTGAALLAKKNKLEVFVSDSGKIPDRYKEELNTHEIAFEEGSHDFERLLVTDLVIKSPGVPEHAPVLRMLKEKGRKVISEIEFGYLFFSGLTIAITGSNGKTTASGLLYHLLKTAGRNVALGGNYGRSFARIIAESDPEWMVLEISSFQLDDIETFRPHVSILLNITPDHLDRYEYSMDRYAAAKFRICMNQGQDDYFIYNADDPAILSRLNGIKSLVRQVPVSIKEFHKGLPSKDGDKIFEMSLKGRHNLLNAACVVEACRILGLTEEEIQMGLKSFVNLPHRLEPVRTIGGVEYINDSKATNVDSVWYALDAMDSPVVWIAGGTDKGNDYTALHELVKKKVKALVCLGVDNKKLVESFRDIVPLIRETRDVREAVRIASDLADSGDKVLLSPACASFDLFQNYMDRGDQFKAAVMQL
ncbi:MAG: UDP-N-acetylmuramoyl-L-alanine--D-glutamate ligase [Saprospiraceae bacterium]|nr:UDP-N-acetylmuramoyl-L-alanine--D-glutamate ligase [Saprospiraceae bacterium]